MSFYLYFTNTQRNVGPFPLETLEDVFSALRKEEKTFMRFNNSLRVDQIASMIAEKNYGAIASNYENQTIHYATLGEYYGMVGSIDHLFMLVNAL